MIILIDMDNTLVDFETGFVSRYKEKYPGAPIIAIEDRNTFYISQQYPKNQALEISLAKGFFLSLPPNPGAIAAVNEMDRTGIDVYFCTSPHMNYDFCIVEKLDWIKTHLGEAWVKRAIIAYDKTLVNGDILIDDRPECKGRNTPVWEHVLFDQPYNRNVNNKRRLNWTNWKSVLDLSQEIAL